MALRSTFFLAFFVFSIPAFSQEQVTSQTLVSECFRRPSGETTQLTRCGFRCVKATVASSYTVIQEIREGVYDPETGMTFYRERAIEKQRVNTFSSDAFRPTKQGKARAIAQAQNRARCFMEQERKRGCRVWE